MNGLEQRAARMSIQHGEGEVGRSFSSNDSIKSASSNHSNQSMRSASPLSPPTSPPQKAAAPSLRSGNDPDGRRRSQRNAAGSQTPRSIQPLLNYILWRVHQETDPAAALDSFIFLSDHPAMRKHAQRFGIRSKTLSEIRYVIARESQDDRNRQYAQQKSIAHTANKKSTSTLGSGRNSIVDGMVGDQEQTSHPVDQYASDEDEILLRRAPKAPAALINSPKGQNRIIDPNQFQRSPARGAPTQLRGSSRGNLRSGGGRGRGGLGNRGRGHAQQQQQTSEPIDPDSFVRPTSSRGAARGGRALWSPS
ncbi:hypothetical protein K461DRAFT_53077 [Myriangium duriaei CBS 260.36]|uniref:Uncharacterized protein n=1 Tax=Myriangium duriaei CBS 260.36 TaxID=1168546 RepID=A0A9P4ISC7_9PEZI|nr:hypothetical protein K461DRAFT_53077 [Myriangium duriaei CBS 260.36]